MRGFGGSALGLAGVAGIVVVGGGGEALWVVVAVVDVFVAGGAVVVGDVAWVVVGCDPALTGAPLLLPQPATSAALRTRVRTARPIGAA
jgi:hypothetical protein